MSVTFTPVGTAVLATFMMPVRAGQQNRESAYKFVVNGLFNRLTKYDIYSNGQTVFYQRLLTTADNIYFGVPNEIHVEWYAENNQTIHYADDGVRTLTCISIA